MLTRKLTLAAAAALLAVPAVASAQVIDGTVDLAYGTPLFVQDTATGFGDNVNPSPLLAGGSEIDGVYANIAGGNLNVLVTGNLETNFNRLILFVDSVAGGDNVVGTSATDTSTGGGTLSSYNGLTFDAGFNADYFLSINGGGSPLNFFADFATLGGTGAFIGQTAGDAQSATFSNGVNFAFDNSNILGVTDSAVAGAAAVLTGFEFSIPLTELGSPTGDISLAGFIAGGDFLSNQVIGGVGGSANLGAATGVNFSQLAGNQFVVVPNSVIPEPASLGLLSVAGLGLLRRRK